MSAAFRSNAHHSDEKSFVEKKEYGRIHTNKHQQKQQQQKQFWC